MRTRAGSLRPSGVWYEQGGLTMPSNPEVRAAMAANLKRERRARGWSMSDLAERAGLAKSNLSLVESAVSNPSLYTLCCLASALDVPVAQLLAPSHSETRLVRRGEGASVDDGPGYMATLLAASPTGSRGDVYWIDEAQAGCERRSAAHAAGTVEHIIMASGAALAGPAFDAVRLGPGDCLRYPGDQPHIFTAVEPGTSAVLLVERP